MIVKGGLLALPGGTGPREADIRVDGERIAEIGPGLEPRDGEETVDAGGLLVLPGGIDPHVHFDDPGYTEREDFHHGSSAAASGGITTVVDMPCTSVPPVTDAASLREKLAVVEKKAVVDFGLHGGVCARSWEQALDGGMAGLEGSVLGFKTYFTSGMETFGRLDHYRFRAVLEKARGLGVPVLLHAEDHDFVQAATAAASREGSGPIHYYRSRPETAEVLAALSAIALAEETGADLHIVHIGTSRVGELIANAGLEGVRVSGETAPHYLAFDLADFERIGSVLKCAPPVKGPGNRERLWELLAGGSLAFVASDHAPCRVEEKRTGSVWTDYGGIPGVGTLLPYMVSEGYLGGRLSLRRLLEVTSGNAARRFGLSDRKGSIEVGKDADFALIDTGGHWIVRGGESPSKGKLTPFEGMRFRGRVVKTILRGRVVYASGTGVTAPPGTGVFQRREAPIR